MTKPIEDIIPRNIDNETVKNLLIQFSNGIEEVVNFGSQILKWDLDIPRDGDDQLPVVLTFRHFLELIDSISILIKNSSIEPCKLILRGVLESFLGIEYMLEKNTLDRCMAFMVWHSHKNLNIYKKFEPNSEQAKQLQSIFDKDKSINGMNVPNIPKITQAINNLEALLKRPEYQKAELEYQRLRKIKGRTPNWYELFNGPKNIQGLADHLNLNALYEILYRNWSGTTHGTEIIHGKLSKSEDNNVEIIQIRSPKDAQSITSWTLNLSIKFFKIYIENRVPDKNKNLQDWYKNIRDFYLKVNGEKQLLTFE